MIHMQCNVHIDIIQQTSISSSFLLYSLQMHHGVPPCPAVCKVQFPHLGVHCSAESFLRPSADEHGFTISPLLFLLNLQAPTKLFS